MSLTTPKFRVGEPVMTYARRFSNEPVPVEAIVLMHVEMEGHYPPVKYIVQHNGILALRDDYTLAREVEDIPVRINHDVSADNPVQYKDFTYDD